MFQFPDTKTCPEGSSIQWKLVEILRSKNCEVEI
jgi:hypothetical protein